MRARVHLVAALALACPAALQAQNYSFQVVDFCDGYAAFPNAMNNAGTIVGGAFNGGMGTSLAFVYQDGACSTIYLGPAGTSFEGITDNELVVGLRGNFQNYLYKGGAFSRLPSYHAAENTYYCCLNTSTGLLAGNYLMTGSLSRYGFLLDKGTFTPLPGAAPNSVPSITGMNKNGIVVGTMTTAVQAGFMYVGGNMQFFQYPGATYTTFNGISDSVRVPACCD